MTEFEQRLTLVIAGLQVGEVLSYGDVAGLAGKANAPRAVGRFLSKTKLKLPWWRVVRADGSLAPVNSAKQQRLLEAEGVIFRGSKIDSAPLGRFS